MSYQATVLADSLSPEGVRLTTLWVTHPRFILAEVNTHRMLSRNSNSSRAIPPERQIAAVRENPFVPETFNKRVKGMGVGEALADDDAAQAREWWLAAATDAAYAAERLLGLDCDKSRINRLLEPFLWHSAVITATEWSNFFALRDNEQAQPEFQIIARMMREALDASVPDKLDAGEWHLPGLTNEELTKQREVRWSMAGDDNTEFWKRVSAGRLARWTSYGKEGDFEDPETAAARCEKLISSFHMSPLEHQATPIPKHVGGAAVFCGNFRGWRQFRKEIPNEHNAALVVE